MSLGQRPQSEVGMLMRDAEALVFEATGSRVPLGTKAELVTAFRRELKALAAQPDRIRDLSKAAHERALRYYAWEAKARKTVQAYDRVLDRRSAPPRFEDQPAMRGEARSGAPAPSPREARRGSGVRSHRGGPEVPLAERALREAQQVGRASWTRSPPG